MTATTRRTAPWHRLRGFTLIELLVVIAIIALVSAAALPVVLPALSERRVSEAARVLQATLAGARDAAIRANEPRGIRLLPDPVLNFSAGGAFASNRFIPIQPAPDYNEGVVHSPTATLMTASGSVPNPLYNTLYLRIAESGPYTYLLIPGLVLDPPTAWKYNIRQGDKIRFNDSGAIYSIAGPVNGLLPANNPERYICYIPAETSPVPNASLPGWFPEYLNLTNQLDDDGDGWVDESCDGIDNDGDGTIDPAFNGLDDDGNGFIDDAPELYFNANASGHFSTTVNEFEQEVFVGIQANSQLPDGNYTIYRRTVVTPGGAETTLPDGAVIDLTTWNASAATFANGSKPLTAAGLPVPSLPERSRLPVDPFSGYVDIMIDPSGQVVSPGAGSGAGFFNANSPIASLPFYHFWITDRDQVVPPLWGTAISTTAPAYNAPYLNPSYSATPPQVNFLPVTQGTVDYAGNPYTGTYLKGERRLVTLFTKTGQIVSNSIELFNQADTSVPYYAAQSGTKESQ